MPEDKYKKIFENSPHAIIILSKLGKIIETNNRIYDWLGYEKEEVLNKSLLSVKFFSKDQKKLALSKFKDRMLGKKIEPYNLKFIKKDGKELIGKIYGIVVNNEDLLMISDVTKEEKLQAQYQELFNNSGSAIAVYEYKDNKFIIKDFNKKAEIIEKKKKQDIVGKDISEVFPGAKKMGIIDALKKVYDTEKPIYFPEAEYVDEKGNISYIENYIYKLPNQDIVAVYDNITDKLMYQKRYKLIYDTSTDAIMTLEPPTWKFTTGNPRTIEIFKTKDEIEFTSNPPWKYSPEIQPDGKKSLDKAKKMIMTAMKQGDHTFYWKHKKLTGEEFDALVTLVKINMGNKSFLQATVKDITEEKRKEEQLISRQEELEKVNKLMMGRELKMIELKQKIKELEKKLGK